MVSLVEDQLPRIKKPSVLPQIMKIVMSRSTTGSSLFSLSNPKGARHLLSDHDPSRGQGTKHLNPGVNINVLQQIDSQLLLRLHA